MLKMRRKPAWLVLAAFFLFTVPSAFAQQKAGEGLPRLAVVKFSGDASEQNAKRVRDMVESAMIDSGNYAIVTTDDIDLILAQQKIALSSISSTANITKLQRENIQYIVTGTVNQQDAESFVSLRMLDVTNARFMPNSPSGIVNMTSMTTIYQGVGPIVANFISGGGSGDGASGRSGAIPEGFVRIEGGTFTMGSPASEAERSGDETQHQVTVSGFYMGKYAVSQAEYKKVMKGENPSYFKGDNLPVENVSWYDAIEYCNARSRQEGLREAYTIDKSRFDPNNEAPMEGDEWDVDNIRWIVTVNKNANGYRLPTEAEWEYACRAGTTTPFSTGNNITTSQANYHGNYPYNGNNKGEYRKKTVPVDSFYPNRWGLYNMHGNVWEWCWDWWGYSMADQTDPAGAASGSARVYRGGSWNFDAQYLRSADRVSFTPSYRSITLGFRVVRP